MEEILNKQIEDSPLQDFEKNELKKIFSTLSPVDQENLGILFSAKPYLIPIFYINLLSKTIAVSRGDSTMFAKITKAELEMIEKIREVE